MKKKHKDAVLSASNSDGKTRSLAAIEGHKWKKGVSPNPGGRPKKFMTLVSEAYRERLGTVSPADPQGRTFRELLAERMVDAAVDGDIAAAREIVDRVEGRPKQAIDFADVTPLHKR